MLGSYLIVVRPSSPRCLRSVHQRSDGLSYLRPTRGGQLLRFWSSKDQALDSKASLNVIVIDLIPFAVIDFIPFAMASMKSNTNGG